MDDQENGNRGSDSSPRMYSRKFGSCTIKDEYAPVIFSQETVSHIVSIDMMSGKVCFIWLMVFLIHFTTFHLIKQRTQTYYNSFSSEKKPRLLVIGALESC